MNLTETINILYLRYKKLYVRIGKICLGMLWLVKEPHPQTKTIFLVKYYDLNL